MPTTFDEGVESSFESDLNRARGYKPVTQREMRDAYSQYKGTGLKFGQVKKNMTDKQLYAKAQATVLTWWRQEHKDDTVEKGQKENFPGKMEDDFGKTPKKQPRERWDGGSKRPVLTLEATRNLVIQSGVNIPARNIPLKYRFSAPSLRMYLATLRRAQAMRQVRESGGTRRI